MVSLAKRIEEIKAAGVVAAGSLTPQKVTELYEVAIEAGLEMKRQTGASWLEMIRAARGMTAHGEMPLAQAMKVYRQWVTTPKVALLPDPPGLDSLIEQMLDAAPSLPPRLWMDIRLAATAQCAGLRLVTFEREVTLLGLEQCLILPRV